MAHRIYVDMIMSDAQKVRDLGRKLYKDNSLGINQAAFVVLNALATGEYRLTKVRRRAKEPEPEAEADKSE